MKIVLFFLFLFSVSAANAGNGEIRIEENLSGSCWGSKPSHILNILLGDGIFYTINIDNWNVINKPESSIVKAPILFRTAEEVLSLYLKMGYKIVGSNYERHSVGFSKSYTLSHK